MKRVYADTGYWMALVNPHDELHPSAMDTSRSIGPVFIVTSEPVLTEFLNDFGPRGPRSRAVASELVNRLKENPNCEVVPWSASLFYAGFLLYRHREDKDWSLTDCASFVIMEAKNISEALAHDKHFEQAGFKALLR